MSMLKNSALGFARPARLVARRKWARTEARHPALCLRSGKQCSRSFSQLQDHYANDHEFFRYTTGRWLRNDSYERSNRYVRFNVKALCEIAAKACGAEKCIGIKKLDEGSFNRVFLLHLDNDAEVIARIPFTISGPPHLLTASEVATLDFVRNVMSIPVPKVLTWSSRAESTPVGTEFMILEKVGGIQLSYAFAGPIAKVADKLEDVLKLLRQMINIDEKFTDLHFARYGSLFYREDIVGYPHATKILKDESRENEQTRKFAIGPLMSYFLWRDERRLMDIDRGPWTTASEYVTGVIRCQQEWLRRFAPPRGPEDPTYRSAENSSPQRHIDVLEECLNATVLAIPPQFSWPTIWHPDLHRGNIFVTKDAPHMLTGIIDWQFTGICPFFHQVKPPDAFRFYGSRVELVEDTVQVILPDDFEELPADEKQLVLGEKFDAQVYAIYRAATKKFNPTAQALLDHPQSPIILEPFMTALDSWDRGLEDVRFRLLGLFDNWEGIVEDHVECPLRYTDEDVKKILDYFRPFIIYQKNFLSLCDKLGCDGYDCIREEKFEATWKIITKLKSRWDEEECGGPFPFQVDEGKSGSAVGEAEGYSRS